ncbi:5'-methylthioadenosine/adenosylhomocysteine nucleosidase [Mechercharimyces sp. CAU 1602]|uniref:5'-methylthioadenosine/adenosylhomocysteine nucleosidase n=1 Tax=Mechercharimyces sp. CAU 1602 TaxID=2973933 RepID=UPI002163AFCE|nr:5'-methylthioadenosine/adenosylhomocysteine nucleosidase [Mechercharimyces sp. CAU 1602]MCS1350113.1 5'-methylthioadenosine/adenosylhomocysteine nucleosidase [Mechercharimyces sp. CAU 1602]
MIGIIGAMDEEISRFQADMKMEKQSEVAGVCFYEGIFAGKSIVLCKSGVGKVNAAICTQVLIDRYDVHAIIFTGVAGALDPNLEIGDCVISTQCQYHDMDVTALGLERGQIPFQEVSVFKADPMWVRLAREAGESIAEGKTVEGKVLSGDQFISSTKTVLQLWSQLEGVCVEMEGAAVAHVCHANGVPFVVIRSISDKADHSATVNFEKFTELASHRSCVMVHRMLEKWQG